MLLLNPGRSSSIWEKEKQQLTEEEKEEERHLLRAAPFKVGVSKGNYTHTQITTQQQITTVMCKHKDNHLHTHTGTYTP